MHLTTTMAVSQRPINVREVMVAPAAADDEEEEEAEGEGAAERGEDFAVGSRVVLHGLKRAAQVSELSKQALTAADRR